MLSSRGSSQPRGWTQVSHIAGSFFTIWPTREAQKEATDELTYKTEVEKCHRCRKQTYQLTGDKEGEE